MPSNYPPDIHNFDHDPRSPFYVEPYEHCIRCEYYFPVDEMHDENYCQYCHEALKQKPENACHE